MTPKTKEQYEEIRQKSAAAIQQAALELFGHQGFHSTSMSQIAKEAGVSKGLIYNYFSSKEALLEEIVNGAMSVGEGIMKILDGPGTPQDRLKSLLLTTVSTIKGNLHFWKLMTSLSFQPEVVDKYQEQSIAKAKANIELLEGLFTQMEAEKPKQEALMLAAALDGMFLHYISLGEYYPMDDMLDYLIEKFCSE